MKRSKNARISKGQIKAIQTLKHKLGLADDTYKSMLAGFGHESCTEFSNGEAGDLIRKLSALLPKDNWRESGKSYGTGARGGQRHLTQLQAERIDLLEKLLGWQRSSTVAFVIRQLGAIKGVAMLMNYEAVKVVTGMQRVLAFDMMKVEENFSGPDRRLLQGGAGIRQKEFYESINNSTNKQLQELYENNNIKTAERG